MLLRTPFSPGEVSAALTHDVALADLELIDHGERVGMVGNGISLEVTLWDENSRTLIENGFETATVRVTFSPARGQVGGEPHRRLFAAVLRLVPGDACAQEQGGGPLGLLRLAGIVFVDPDFINPEQLTRYGYAPEQLVVGIPQGLAEASMN